MPKGRQGPAHVPTRVRAMEPDGQTCRSQRHELPSNRPREHERAIVPVRRPSTVTRRTSHESLAHGSGCVVEKKAEVVGRMTWCGPPSWSHRRGSRTRGSRHRARTASATARLPDRDRGTGRAGRGSLSRGRAVGGERERGAGFVGGNEDVVQGDGLGVARPPGDRIVDMQSLTVGRGGMKQGDDRAGEPRRVALEVRGCLAAGTPRSTSAG